MADDILRHGAHPVFYYGQHYLGTLDAYLQAPFFLVFGPTNLALHLTTTVQTLLFFILLYRFTRTVYSPLVAGGTLVLLTVAPGQALFFMQRGGVHAQDTLLLSVLLLWLVLVRLRRSTSTRMKRALNLGIGLVAGLGSGVRSWWRLSWWLPGWRWVERRFAGLELCPPASVTFPPSS
jgi:hypothetical protein